MPVNRSVRKFTLTEMLVVVTVIALLAGLLGTPLLGARRKARREAQAAQNIKILTAAERYREDFGAYPLEVRKAGNESRLKVTRMIERQIPPDPNRDDVQKNADHNRTSLFDALTKDDDDLANESALDDPENWYGDFIDKGDVSVRKKGSETQLIDLWGDPLVYWVRIREENQSPNAKGSYYPPVQEVSKEPLLPSWLIELMAAKAAGSIWDARGTVSGTALPGGVDDYGTTPPYAIRVEEKDGGGAVIGMNNNWYYIGKDQLRNLSTSNVAFNNSEDPAQWSFYGKGSQPSDYNDTIGVISQNSTQIGSGGAYNVTESTPNGFINALNTLPAALVGGAANKDATITGFANTFIYALIEQVFAANAFPPGGLSLSVAGRQVSDASSWRNLLSNKPNLTLAECGTLTQIWNQITPNSKQPDIAKAVVEACRGGNAILEKDPAMVPEIWSLGADGKAGKDAGGFWCLRLGAFRKGFMGTPDDSRCLYNHSEDKDNVGGDLNIQRK